MKRLIKLWCLGRNMADWKTAVFLLSLTFMQRFRKENFTLEHKICSREVKCGPGCIQWSPFSHRGVIRFCSALEEVIIGRPEIKFLKWRRLVTQGKFQGIGRQIANFGRQEFPLLRWNVKARQLARHQLSFVLIWWRWKLVMYHWVELFSVQRCRQNKK